MQSRQPKCAVYALKIAEFATIASQYFTNDFWLLPSYYCCLCWYVVFETFLTLSIQQQGYFANQHSSRPNGSTSKCMQHNVWILIIAVSTIYQRSPFICTSGVLILPTEFVRWSISLLNVLKCARGILGLKMSQKFLYNLYLEPKLRFRENISSNFELIAFYHPIIAFSLHTISKRDQGQQCM